MKIQSVPKQLFIEILNYLADYERLDGLDQILEGETTVSHVRTALREVATQLKTELKEEKKEGNLPNYQKDERLSSHVRHLLSVLSPGDERKLLSLFGLLEN